MGRSQPPVTFAEFDLQVLLPPRWNQLSPAARAGSSLPPPLTQASEQQKSIFRLGVLFGEIHISPSVLVLISSGCSRTRTSLCQARGGLLLRRGLWPVLAGVKLVPARARVAVSGGAAA